MPINLKYYLIPRELSTIFIWYGNTSLSWNFPNNNMVFKLQKVEISHTIFWHFYNYVDTMLFWFLLLYSMNYFLYAYNNAEFLLFYEENGSW